MSEMLREKTVKNMILEGPSQSPKNRKDSSVYIFDN